MGNISEFYKRLRDLCEDRSMTINELVRILNLSTGSPTAWKSGSIPRHSTLTKIADYFSVTTDYLLAKSSIMSDSESIRIAQNALLAHLSHNPNVPSGERIRILFDVSGFDRMTVCFNLEIDQCILNSWIEHLECPPRPIVDQFLEVFHLQPSQLLNSSELLQYNEESYEWGDSALSQNKITPVLTEKDRRDIAKDLEAMMAQLDSGGDMMFDGDPISDEARASIRNALQMGLEIAKVKNKERFTPKKYRKD